MSSPSEKKLYLSKTSKSDRHVPRILLIEDDESTRYLVSLYLQTELNVEIISASCAEEGRRSFVQCRADLIVCDQNMGDGLGTQVLEFIRQFDQKIPFILFTSDKRGDLPNIDAFECRYIQKPRITELIDEVAHHLGGVHGHP